MLLVGRPVGAARHAACRSTCSAPRTPTLQTVREGLRLVAPLAGAGLYTVAGGGAVALLNAATFLAATVALLALKVREPKPVPRHRARSGAPSPPAPATSTRTLPLRRTVIALRGVAWA